MVVVVVAVFFPYLKIDLAQRKRKNSVTGVKLARVRHAQGHSIPSGGLFART